MISALNFINPCLFLSRGLKRRPPPFDIIILIIPAGLRMRFNPPQNKKFPKQKPTLSKIRDSCKDTVNNLKNSRILFLKL